MFGSATISRQHARPRVVMAAACGGLFTYGILSAFLGATLPELHSRLSFGLEKAGWLFGFFYLPQIPGVFVAGMLVDRLGKKQLLVGGCLLATTAILGITQAETYTSLAILLLILGTAGSLISTSANTLVTDLYPQTPCPALNLGHAFFGLGAVSVPALVAFLVVPFGLRSVLWVVGALIGAIAVLSLAEPFPAPRTYEGFRWREVSQAVFTRGVLLLAVIAFFITALLASLAAWIRLFLEQTCGASLGASSLLLTLFWALISLGRLAAGRIARKVPDARLALGASLGFVLGLAMLAKAAGVWSAGIVIGLCGLCYAPIYPTMVGLTHSMVPKFFGTALGIFMAASLTGGLVLPVVAGYVASAASLRAGIWVLAGSGILMVWLQVILLGAKRARNQPV